MVSVLVTGGTGYIGRWLAAELVAAGIEPVLFDMRTADAEARPSLPAGLRFVPGDVTDRARVISAASDGSYEAIIHLAGIVTMGCERDPDLGLRVNVGGTHNVLEAARLAGIPRVVFASSISVYGPDVPQPIFEAGPTEPTTWYGQSKLMSEQLGLYYLRRYGLDFRVARLAAIVGPFRSAASGSATMYTSTILEQAALGQPCLVDVDEQAAVPVCYVPDAAQALVALATTEVAPRTIYNVGTCRATVLELIEIAKRRFPDAEIVFRPEPQLAAVARSWSRWELDISAARDDLHWSPAHTLETMADDLIRKVSQHQ